MRRGSRIRALRYSRLRGVRLGPWIWIALAVVLLLIAGAVLIRQTTLQPPLRQTVPVVCDGDAPTMPAGAPLKVMTWNVQYMAGKNHVFFYDLRDGSGPDERPRPDEIALTLSEVARIIREENPDVILLQEVDDGAARTDKADQLASLLELLPDTFRCHTSAFYWQAAFVPHPRILGSAGMKLSILSKYRIDNAVRHQLPLIPADPITQAFSLKRAVLEATLPQERGDDLTVLNTHLDAFAQGTDTMERQVREVGEILDGLGRTGRPWVIGGDFNLLPPGGAYGRLPADEQAYFRPETELAPLFDAFPSVPSRAEVDGPDYARWYTHFPNGGPSKGPDRTIDYLFHSPLLSVGEHYVRGWDTLAISDHLPVVATFTPATR